MRGYMKDGDFESAKAVWVRSLCVRSFVRSSVRAYVRAFVCLRARSLAWSVRPSVGHSWLFSLLVSVGVGVCRWLPLLRDVTVVYNIECLDIEKLFHPIA